MDYDNFMNEKIVARKQKPLTGCAVLDREIRFEKPGDTKRYTFTYHECAPGTERYTKTIWANRAIEAIVKFEDWAADTDVLITWLSFEVN